MTIRKSVTGNKVVSFKSIESLITKKTLFSVCVCFYRICMLWIWSSARIVSFVFYWFWDFFLIHWIWFVCLFLWFNFPDLCVKTLIKINIYLLHFSFFVCFGVEEYKENRHIHSSAFFIERVKNELSESKLTVNTATRPNILTIIQNTRTKTHTNRKRRRRRVTHFFRENN